nr:ethanolamine permease [Pseudomonadales bacterium]
LNMAVFGAVISYACVMASYIKLRLTKPNMERPYRSPLGIPGAAVGLILSLVALVATVSDSSFLPAVTGVIIFLAVGLLYFLCYSRHHLVAQAPEEEVALIADAAKDLA